MAFVNMKNDEAFVMFLRWQTVHAINMSVSSFNYYTFWCMLHRTLCLKFPCLIVIIVFMLAGFQKISLATYKINWTCL